MPLTLWPSYDGEVDEWSVTPDLPYGVTLDTDNGIISGIPSVATEETRYEVTGANGTGLTSAFIIFGIKVMPPKNVRYEQIDDIYTVGEELNLAPTLDGGATDWKIEPDLPDGFSFDFKTGCIAGAPTTVTDEASYVVTASNEGGGTSVVIKFAVLAPPPKSLSYPEATANLSLGEVVEWEPRIEGGACTSFAVEPALPSGLELNPKTGVISGSPTGVTERATYTVTAKNAKGAASAALSFECAEPVE